MTEVKTRASVLSNGEYAVLLTEAGGGCSALRGFALTRWQPDPTSEKYGALLYLRDRDSGVYWSLAEGESGGVRTGAGWFEQWCVEEGIELKCRTRVVQGSNAEVRTITIANHSGRARNLDLTSYAELSLNTHAADAAHPAFSKLFVQTAYDAERHALLAWRRQRSHDDRTIWVGQRLTGATEFETDRARFIGRTRSINAPLAMSLHDPLTRTVGAVLDPAFCLRAPVLLEPNATVDLELFLCAADTRMQVEQLLDARVPASSADCHEPAALGLPDSWLAGLTLDLDSHEWQDRGAAHRPEPPLPTRSDFGGFSDDGSAYLLEVASDQPPTPQPWINVVANEQFGFLISEMGAGYTWAANSRENRLTPWSNDAVSDPHGEALLLCDDETRSTWSVLPGPAPADAPYRVEHGFGYSRFVHESHGLRQEACLFVPRGDPVKITRVRVTNESVRERKLSLLSYAHLVLGGLPVDTRATVTTSREDGVILAANSERGEFSRRVAFATVRCDAEDAEVSATGSRRSFVNRRVRLDERFGADLDPCAALQLTFALAPGATLECAFLLGEAEDESATRACVARYDTLAAVDAAFATVTHFWRELLGRVQVHTPARGLDVMLNGWLAYQNLVCRIWARSAFFQSGGAFGFRDQLQDSSALIYLDPALTRAQILLHAAHQFVEGDVLHWWHPPESKGIRTRFSDDLLWLPYITSFYMARTGDRAILDEAVRFVTAERVEAPEDEVFVWPEHARKSAPLYEHCCRALDRSLTKGEHGLPLMGVGDWNDGMNRVGREGRGESVWLGFFLFDILTEFIPVCSERGDRARAERYTDYIRDLQAALNDGGWDGAWYRRAYYDDGAPLGSSASDECRIDALAQAWAVISGAAPAERATQAIDAMQEHLVAEQDGIIRLLDPAFDKTPHDPGYIKGYVPGVRENGGQYTHAALWAVRALADMGLRERAAPLLEMLSPVTRSRQADIYKGEPYVIAADVYGEPPHVGRAGWTWYTGSAGWMYRVYLESILGFDLRADVVRLRPCLPSAWGGYSLRYRFEDGTDYNFEVRTTRGESSASVGRVVDGAIEIPIVRDGGDHVVRISAGPDVLPRYSQRTPPLLRTTRAKK